MKHVDLSTESGDVVPHFLVDRLDPFRTAFTTRTWKKSLVLVMGVLLAPGKRTVSSCLRITGYAECKAFSTFHQVLNRARWESHELARQLLHVLVIALVRSGPVIIGVDDTIERRWGPKVYGRGIYRDPVRSSVAILPKPVACAGSASCYSFLCHGREVSRPCHFYRFLPRRSAMPVNAD